MIIHNKPTIDSEDRSNVLAALKGEILASGQIIQEFERKFTKFFKENAATSCAVSSGTSALFLALHSLGIREKHKVIVPTYVCSAVLNAIYMLGADPLLADINEDDFNISVDFVKKIMSSRVKAIVIPHIYGVPADIDKFKELNIPIVEDCAQAIGARYKSKHLGTFGDMAIFSFYATKIMTTGHGGMIYSSKKRLIENALDYREFDCRKKYYPRFNFKMTDFQAALGISQLKKLDYFIKRRCAIGQRYLKAIETKKYLESQRFSKGKIPVYYRFIIRTSKGISKLQKYFLEKGIKTIVPMDSYELLHRYLKNDKRCFPCAERIAKTTLSIPLYPSLKDEEVAYICDILEGL